MHSVERVSSAGASLNETPLLALIFLATFFDLF